MTHEEVIKGLEVLLHESKVAKATIDYSYQSDRLYKKVNQLEERIRRMEEVFKKHNISL